MLAAFLVVSSLGSLRQRRQWRSTESDGLLDEGVVVGTARGFEHPEGTQRPARPASFGDLDGFWHMFQALDGSEVYERGKADKYHWTQNSEQVQLYVPVSTDCDRDQVDAALKNTRLNVESPVQFGGTLAHTIDADSSTWYFATTGDDQMFIIFDLIKADEYYNWADVFVPTT